jgi:hypothetical protein
MPQRGKHSVGSGNLEEIAGILAAGLMRLRARQSTPVYPHFGERALDCVRVQSGTGGTGVSDPVGIQR